MIHLIDIDTRDQGDPITQPVVAWGISFPRTQREERRVEYVVNTTWLRENFVDANLPWDFFWARGLDGRVLLTLSHATGSAPTTTLPRLRDIEVTLSPPDDFKLLDSNQRDIFQTLCRDIISAAAQVESEAEAVSAALMRTWRWHHLLRGGRGTLLSPEEQRGLLGELFVLERLLLPRIDASSAVTAWRGPLGAPKDFEIAREPHHLSQSRRRASWTREESTRCFCTWSSWMRLRQMPRMV